MGFALEVDINVKENSAVSAPVSRGEGWGGVGVVEGVLVHTEAENHKVQ